MIHRSTRSCSPMSAKQVRRLDDVRRRTHALLEPVSDEDRRRQMLPILSPMVWDLGHIAFFEEYWLLREVAGREAIDPGYDRLYDPLATPRVSRGTLVLPERRVLQAYMDDVRTAVAQDLETVSSDPRDAYRSLLVHNGFVYEMVAQHEEQHQETLLQAMQAMSRPPYVPLVRDSLPQAGHGPKEMVFVPGGSSLMGTDRMDFVYDNEKPCHEVFVPDFLIDPVPVTNGAYLAFVEAGGYERPEFWSEAGWVWKEEAHVRAPGAWVPGERGWLIRYMDDVQPLALDDPVVHVSFYEAEAYARFVGKRLPTEEEWEKAASWDPIAGVQRCYPWGDDSPMAHRVNLDQRAFKPAPAGAYPAGASAYGVHQLLGDVWEWTASDFLPYPGFKAFPYVEYSEIFFGNQYKVLRGGSWATRPGVARSTFRNWDFPIRRQIFAGFRCASDVR